MSSRTLQWQDVRLSGRDVEGFMQPSSMISGLSRRFSVIGLDVVAEFVSSDVVPVFLDSRKME
jgi:hypothetical protein